jgi:uncharacterized membrane protein
MIYKIITVIIVAAAPLSELRGAIPLGINLFKLNPLSVVIFSVAGNLLPVLVISYFFDPLIYFFSQKIPAFHRFISKHLETARHKIKKAVSRYGFIGLVIFVAIPLPLFGVYTGAAGAVLLGMPRRRIIYACALGVLAAAAIVYFVDALIFKLF